MRTETIKIYEFSELSEQAKQKAIENVRDSYYVYNDFSTWTIDNCYLLEPPHKELENLFGDKYKDILIKNTRQIYFSLDRDRYIDISKAMEIEDDLAFYQWLGIPLDLAGRLQHTIHSDSIEFFDFDDEFFSAEELSILELAEEKFSNHCEDILNSIESGIDYRFSDEAIIEDIQANNIEFTEEGEVY